LPGAPGSEKTPPRAGLGSHIHAWVLAHLGVRYERMVADRKRALFAGLDGSVLEIGPGTGPNLVYYPPGIRWLGVEPNPYMVPYLRTAAARAGLPVDLRPGMAERLPAEDNSMDTVVSTLVLCSVHDPDGVLREIRRVLKPGGQFLFLEHVAAPPGRPSSHAGGPLGGTHGDSKRRAAFETPADERDRRKLAPDPERLADR